MKRLMILMFSVWFFGCANNDHIDHGDFRSPKISISKMYTITSGNKIHSTTRGTIDLVHRHQATWFVFHGSDQRNAFQTSLDGITWSALKSGANSTFGELSRSYLIEGNKITKLYTRDIDPDPKIGNTELFICEGTMRSSDITWGSSQLVIPAGPAGRSSGWAYYNDLKRDTSGRIHFTGRHHNSNTNITDIFWMRTQNPFDNLAWENPFIVVPGSPSIGVDGHENIQLDGNEVYVIARTNSCVYVPGSPAKFYGRHFDGTEWEAAPTELGISDGIGGSDRRLSAVFDPNTNTIHLTYIDNNRNLYHRTLSKPYDSSDWSVPVLVTSNALTCTIGIDTTVSPSRIALVYGDQLASDGGRLHTGELYLKFFDGQEWESNSFLISEPETIYNWYPNMIRDVSEDIGVMYLKGNWNSESFDIMFSLITTKPHSP